MKAPWTKAREERELEKRRQAMQAQVDQIKAYAEGQIAAMATLGVNPVVVDIAKRLLEGDPGPIRVYGLLHQPRRQGTTQVMEMAQLWNEIRPEGAPEILIVPPSSAERAKEAWKKKRAELVNGEGDDHGTD